MNKKEAAAAHEKFMALHRLIHLEFHLKDVLQVIIGASILAIPVGFTEEAWRLGENLPLINILGVFILSFSFISIFIYYNYYMDHLKSHWGEFIKRAFATYIFSFLVVSVIMTLIERTPWTVDLALSLKRVVLVTFPASMSASVADMIK